MVCLPLPKLDALADAPVGLGLVGTILLHQIISLMSPPISADDAAAAQDHGHPRGSHLGSSLTYPRSASIVGYCLLPLVLVSTLGIVVPLDGLFGYIVTILSITWCSYSSSSMFTVAGKLFWNKTSYNVLTSTGRMTSMRGLVAYPMVLFYGSFGIMAIFSSRGTGQLGKVAAGQT